jgi:hypothetical protein
VSAPLRIALMRHDHAEGESPERRLALALGAAGHEADVLAPQAGGVLELPFRLRKIGDRPARMPLALLALARGGYDLAHAFTAQDAAVAALWSRISGRPSVFTVREPLTRGELADRRLRLATLRLALEGVDAVLAPGEGVAESLRRWMAVDPRLVEPESAAAHVALYEELGGSPAVRV